MAFKRWNIGLVIVGKLAVGTIGNTLTFAVIPDKTATGPGRLVLTFKHIFAAAAAVRIHPGFFGKIVGVSCGAPVMPVGAHFGIDVEVVEQHKFPRQSAW